MDRIPITNWLASRAPCMAFSAAALHHRSRLHRVASPSRRHDRGVEYGHESSPDGIAQCGPVAEQRPAGFDAGAGTPMFDRLTRNSCRALDLARERAQAVDASWIGVDHLLLGLLEMDCGALQVLRGLHVEVELLRDAVRRHGETQACEVHEPQRLPPYTDEVARVFEFAIEESGDRLGPAVATEHLLAAIARDSRNGVSDDLARHGATLARVRAASRLLISSEARP